MKLAVHPLTPERFGDLETIFESRGCSVARGCWCMYYRVSGKTEMTRPGTTREASSRQALEALAAQDPPPGLIGYRGKTPVGWLSLGPRADYAKLARSPVMKPVDDQPVWSVVCFVVPSAWRGQGVAAALLDGAIAWARGRGVRLLEAYPVDKDHAAAKEASWFGSKRLFDHAGFEEVARRRPDRPVVRLQLVDGDREAKTVEPPSSPVDALIAKYTPAMAQAIAACRDKLRGLVPRGYELVYDNYNALAIGYAPTDRGSAAVVSIAGYPRWVTLFFLYGADLPDPDGLLQGDGSRVRSIRLRSPDDIDRPAIRQLIALALEPDAAAFAAASPLQTIVKAVATKQRARRPAAA